MNANKEIQRELIRSNRIKSESKYHHPPSIGFLNKKQCPDILYIRSLQCSDRLLLLYVCRRYEIHVCVVPINDVHILSLMFLLSVACFFPGKSRTPFYLVVAWSGW